MMMKLFGVLVALVPVWGEFYSADDSIFHYAGHWELPGKVARADWPCSGFRFDVTTVNDGEASVGLKLDMARLRVNVVVVDATGAVVTSKILESECTFSCTKEYDVAFGSINAGTYTVSVTKLTQAAPYGNGLGKRLTSVLGFHGVEIDTNSMTLQHPPIGVSRRIGFIGASDTAGYCVDGSPKTSEYSYRLNPWAYDNCDMTSAGLLGRRLEAEVSVQAIAGIGLTQNAFAEHPVMLGEGTMPGYYKRALQTRKPRWNSHSWRPDLVVVSLGGNDFNHQKNVPSDETFTAAYEDFLLGVIEPYLENGPVPTIVSICGQGDPTETERDPNNDRCRPCPHVKNAMEAFREKHGATIRAEYVFVPCDGTVITGHGDIGCDGHKNRIGQEKVADFLEPRLRDIMDWSDPIDGGAASPGRPVLP